MFKDIPCCNTCIHANLYVPYWMFPFAEPKCIITGMSINHDDICCEHYDDGKNTSKNCIVCGVNISDLGYDEVYCEYCAKKL